MTALDLLPVVPAETCCAPAVNPSLDEASAVGLAARLKALADPTRLRLLSIIAAHEGNEACVCDLTEPVGLTQPTVSHHLKLLVDAGFLTREKRGVWAYYRATEGGIADVVAALGLATAKP